jgi:PhnB protein
MAKKKGRRPGKPPGRRKPVGKPVTTPAASGLAPGMQSINSYLAVANVAASMAFLENAFGFARGVVLPDPDGQLRYAEMRHGNSVVMLIRKGDPATASGGTSALYTYVGDVDGQLARARAAGAGVGEAEDKPWGDRVAVVTDPDGHRWVMATFKKLAPFS